MKVLLQPYYLIALALIGIADTLYLSIEKFMGVTPSCVILNGCDTVLNSVYAKFYGVPLAYLGLVFYAFMLGLALLLAFDPESKGLRWGVLLYTLIGFLLSISFELLQALVIHALCLYCAISAITTLALFVIALWYFFSTRKVL